MTGDQTSQQLIVDTIIYQYTYNYHVLPTETNIIYIIKKTDEPVVQLNILNNGIYTHYTVYAHFTKVSLFISYVS